MTKRVRLVLFLAVCNLIVSIYYLFVGFRLKGLYSQFDASIPSPTFNQYFGIYLIFALFNFIYGYYLKSSEKQGTGIGKVSHIMMLLFLSAPLLYLILSMAYYIVTIMLLYNMTTTIM